MRHSSHTQTITRTGLYLKYSISLFVTCQYRLQATTKGMHGGAKLVQGPYNYPYQSPQAGRWVETVR